MYTALRAVDTKRNVHIVQSVLTKDPADFRPNFDPLWIPAVGDNDAVLQNCRNRRKSQRNSLGHDQLLIICPPCLHFPVVFPWTSWLPGLRSQDYPNLVPRVIRVIQSAIVHSKPKTRSLAIWKTSEFPIVPENSTPRLGATRIRLARSPPELEYRVACRAWLRTL